MIYRGPLLDMRIQLIWTLLRGHLYGGYSTQGYSTSGNFHSWITRFKSGNFHLAFDICYYLYFKVGFWLEKFNYECFYLFHSWKMPQNKFSWQCKKLFLFLGKTVYLQHLENWLHIKRVQIISRQFHHFFATSFQFTFSLQFPFWNMIQP